MGARIIGLPGESEPPITGDEFEDALNEPYNLRDTEFYISRLTGNTHLSTAANFEVSNLSPEPEYGVVKESYEQGQLTIKTGPNFPETLRKHADLGRQMSLDMPAVSVNSFGIITSANR